jgi:tRNA G37 N-methylase Trm5
MVLPESAIDYLDLALSKAKENSIIHLYTFQYTNKIKQTHAQIKKMATKSNKKIKILKSVKVGQFKKDYYRFCIDFEVSKKS